MLVCKIGREQPADVLESQFEVTRRHDAAEERADFFAQTVEGLELVGMLVRRTLEFGVAVGVKRSQLAQQFAQLEVEIERRSNGGLEERSQPRAVAIERAQSHELFELDPAHGVYGETASGH